MACMASISGVGHGRGGFRESYDGGDSGRPQNLQALCVGEAAEDVTGEETEVQFLAAVGPAAECGRSGGTVPSPSREGVETLFVRAAEFYGAGAYHEEGAC